MAAIVGRVSRQALLRVPGSNLKQKAELVSWSKLSRDKRAAVVLGSAAAASGTGIAIALTTAVLAHGVDIYPPKLPWYHLGYFRSYDAAGARRGFQIYKQVCAACHSLGGIAFRNMIGFIMSEAEVKQEAKEWQITDGPDDQGNMFLRPGKTTDLFPKPYANKQAARAANNGANPPDLAYMAKAAVGQEDYVFMLLTSYCDPPPGVELGDGQYYNPYFKGGTISMAQALYNEIVEYEDGTPCTQSQAAKDIISFLVWVAMPERETREKMGAKALLALSIICLGTYAAKRTAFIYLKSKVVQLRPPVPKKK